jgi:DNA-binding NarL/FixJ family response regulator
MGDQAMAISESTPPARAAGAVRPATRRYRVLLAGARPDVRAAAVRLLRDEAEFELCGSCASLAEAIEACRAECPDIVITDMLLADGDAFELLRRLCQQQPGVRVLGLSARHEALCAERLLRAGALGYVMSTAPAQEVRRAIRRVAGGEMHISAALGVEFERRFAQRRANADRSPRCALEVLSVREFQVFQLIGNGMAPSAIANALCVSVKTIESHRQHIRDKLALGRGPQFTRCAVECATRCRLERSIGATCELDPRYRPLPGTGGTATRL